MAESFLNWMKQRQNYRGYRGRFLENETDVEMSGPPAPMAELPPQGMPGGTGGDQGEKEVKAQVDQMFDGAQREIEGIFKSLEKAIKNTWGGSKGRLEMDANAKKMAINNLTQVLQMLQQDAPPTPAVESKLYRLERLILEAEEMAMPQRLGVSPDDTGRYNVDRVLSAVKARMFGIIDQLRREVLIDKMQDLHNKQMAGIGDVKRDIGGVKGDIGGVRDEVGGVKKGVEGISDKMDSLAVQAQADGTMSPDFERIFNSPQWEKLPERIRDALANDMGAITGDMKDIKRSVEKLRANDRPLNNPAIDDGLVQMFNAINMINAGAEDDSKKLYFWHRSSGDSQWNRATYKVGSKTVKFDVSNPTHLQSLIGKIRDSGTSKIVIAKPGDQTTNKALVVDLNSDEDIFKAVDAIRGGTVGMDAQQKKAELEAEERAAADEEERTRKVRRQQRRAVRKAGQTNVGGPPSEEDEKPLSLSGGTGGFDFGKNNNNPGLSPAGAAVRPENPEGLATPKEKGETWWDRLYSRFFGGNK